MQGVFQADEPDVFSRKRGLVSAALAALVLHGLMLSWLLAARSGIEPPAPLEQGIFVDLSGGTMARAGGASVPASRERDSASEPQERQSPPARLPKPPPQPEVRRPEPAREAVRNTPRRNTPAPDRKPSPSEERAPESPPSPGAPGGSSGETGGKAGGGAGHAVQGGTGPAVQGGIANPKPVYPDLARRRGQEGVVYLLAQVDEQGALMELAVERSSGYPLLDAAAMKAVKTWRFRPGARDGRPERGSVRIPIYFRLR